MRKETGKYVLNIVWKYLKNLICAMALYISHTTTLPYLILLYRFSTKKNSKKFLNFKFYLIFVWSSLWCHACTHKYVCIYMSQMGLLIHGEGNQSRSRNLWYKIKLCDCFLYLDTTDHDKLDSQA